MISTLEPYAPDDLIAASALVALFQKAGLRARVAALEAIVVGKTTDSLSAILEDAGVGPELVAAAVQVKRAAAQINEVIHTVGMLLCLEELLEDGEVIIGVSLAAANTGRNFDLVTDRRIAEFTFIDWKGGSESIRKQKIFKDFYLLAEAATEKRRELYFLGAKHAHKVFSSKSACAGMLRKFAFLREKFIQQYGSKMTVREYYELHKTRVQLCNIEIVAPRTARHFAMSPSHIAWTVT